MINRNTNLISDMRDDLAADARCADMKESDEEDEEQ
jgi:hypothetical protein